MSYPTRSLNLRPYHRSTKYSSSWDGCDLCKKAELLDQEIADTERALERLRQRRENMKTLLNRRHDRFILRLPIEIASRVFLFCHTIEPPDHAIPFQVEQVFDPFAPVLLGSICRDWRTIAYSTPALWNTIVLDAVLSNALPNFPTLVKEWCDRAASLPLYVRLDVDDQVDTSVYPDIGEIIDILNTYSSQWRSLFVTIPYALLARFQSQAKTPLEAVSISTFGPEGSMLYKNHAKFDLGIATRTSLLEVNSVAISNINVDWSNLTSFYTCGTLVAEFLQVLTIAHRLQHADFDCLHEDDSETPPTPLLHHHLHKLAITQHPQRLWDCLTLPALSNLSCHSLDGVPWISFRRFLLRSRCRIKEMYLGDFGGLPASDFMETVSALKELESLSLNMNNNVPATFFHKMFYTATQDRSQPEPFLPHLMNLQYDVNNREDQNVDWAPLSLLLSHRPTSTSRPLRKIFVVCFGVDLLDLDEDVLENVFLARANGIEVDITSH